MSRSTRAGSTAHARSRTCCASTSPCRRAAWDRSSTGWRRRSGCDLAEVDEEGARARGGNGVPLLLIEEERLLDHRDRLGRSTGCEKDGREVDQRVAAQREEVGLRRQRGSLAAEPLAVREIAHPCNHLRARSTPLHVRREILSARRL